MPSPTAPVTAAADRADRKNSLSLRLWHWGSAAVISGLLITILFLFVILKMKTVGPEFQQVLQKEGVTMSREQVRGLTRIISHRIWDWHIYLGVTLAFLLLYRVVLEFFQRGRQRFSVKLRTARQLFRQQGTDLRDVRHSLVVKYSYLAFYLMLTVMVTTGLMLVYADDFEVLEKLEHTVEEVHNFTMYLIIAFIVLHVAGVVWAESTKNKGIVSDMINGGD
ncbi:Ni,Fe-hydrogenase I cytochrome b subunit [Hymenobacter daecheongensis DSM 21074]|uniref:Ni,Fe-hydrogenase I cytochrome b subunit n=1 Tax=Hymenobacter daecheongensis DSM 21074 TaxID=1121955 RepID=A0A1M6GYZ8_9BACT|nr:cytochrome b/b6 domain-containing protein [Hymenobacter daecheongensis]SHJ15157.1 Ni,Fe-hydrogenase I cytochrome b subunit [Hymenobacter daecheongensis DSM 21074]